MLIISNFNEKGYNRLLIVFWVNMTLGGNISLGHTMVISIKKEKNGRTVLR